jgi:hypothetical protein
MYKNLYQLEYESKAMIDGYHRDALRAEQLRIAWTNRRSRIAAAAGSVRSTVRSLIV